MKRRNLKWSWILLMAGAFASCSKQEAEVEGTVNSLAVNDEVFDSGWEQYPNWQKSDSSGFQIYFTNRQIPAITQDVLDKATMISFSKVATSIPEYSRFTEPIHLDYYFFPPNTKPIPGHFHWYDVHTRGNVRISFSMLENTPFPAGLSPDKFWFRHIVIPPHILQSMGLTADKIKYEYNYNQLVDLLGIKP